MKSDGRSAPGSLKPTSVTLLLASKAILVPAPVKGDHHLGKRTYVIGAHVDFIVIALTKVVDVVGAVAGRKDECVGTGLDGAGWSSRRRRNSIDELGIAPHVVGAGATDQRVVAGAGVVGHGAGVADKDAIGCACTADKCVVAASGIALH